MDKDFDIEVCGMGGTYNKNYAGSFPNHVEKIIRSVIYGRVLSFFSGISRIGEERIDLLRPEATLNIDVRDFIKSDKRQWDFVIADPPYAIKSAPEKLKAYGSVSPFSGNVPFQREMAEYLRNHVKNILWLDLCAPIPKGFKRIKLWILLPGGWHRVRVLSWLKNTNL